MLKHLIKLSPLACALAVLLLSLPICASAVSDTLETQEVSDAYIETFLRNVDMEVIQSEPVKRSISCFDVNGDGTIAVGYETENLISVYSPEGRFLYGYRFECSGDYSLLWEDDNICIYFVRSDVLATFDSNGNCTQFRKISSTYQNNKFIRNTFDVHSRQVGANRYYMENDLLISSGYARLVFEQTDGETRVAYDASMNHNTGTIITSFVVVAFIVCIILVILHKYKVYGRHT